MKKFFDCVMKNHIIAVVIVIVVYLFWVTLKQWFENLKKDKTNAKIGYEAEQTLTEEKKGELESSADTIYNSFGLFNDDEDTVYSEMQSLHNQLEYNYLVKAFGVRDSMNLKSFLTSKMSTSELENIKKILKTKKINML